MGRCCYAVPRVLRGVLVHAEAYQLGVRVFHPGAAKAESVGCDAGTVDEGSCRMARGAEYAGHADLCASVLQRKPSIRN